ncbi:hypothetical protein ABKV19_026213 [Rosa sericea]
MRWTWVSWYINMQCALACLQRAFVTLSLICVLMGVQFMPLFKNAVVFRVVNYELVFPTELYIEGLGHGNLLEEEAISLLNMVKTLPTELMLKNNCICLAPDANLIRDVSVKYKTETNSVIQLYFQIERAVGLSPPD